MELTIEIDDHYISLIEKCNDHNDVDHTSWKTTADISAMLLERYNKMSDKDRTVIAFRKPTSLLASTAMLIGMHVMAGINTAFDAQEGDKPDTEDDGLNGTD